MIRRCVLWWRAESACLEPVRYVVWFAGCWGWCLGHAGCDEHVGLTRSEGDQGFGPVLAVTSDLRLQSLDDYRAAARVS